MAFLLRSKLVGLLDEVQHVLGTSGTQYAYGDACKISNGQVLQLAAQTDKVSHIYVSMDTLASQLRPGTADKPGSGTAKELETLALIPCAGNGTIWEATFAAATFDNVAVVSATASTVLFANGSGANGDFTGGQVLIVETGEQKTISSSTYGGGNYTLNVVPNWTTTPTSSNTLRVVPWSVGATGVKFASSNPQQGISVAIADKTGGNVNIQGVNLAKRTVLCSFVDVP